MVPDYGLDNTTASVRLYDTGDADYFNADGVLIERLFAGMPEGVEYITIDSVAANVEDAVPKPKPTEPFYAKFTKKGKKDYLSHDR